MCVCVCVGPLSAVHSSATTWDSRLELRLAYLAASTFTVKDPSSALLLVKSPERCRPSQYLKVGVCTTAARPARPYNPKDGLAISIKDGELGKEGVPGLQHVANGGARRGLHLHLERRAGGVLSGPGTSATALCPQFRPSEASTAPVKTTTLPGLLPAVPTSCRPQEQQQQPQRSGRRRRSTSRSPRSARRTRSGRRAPQHRRAQQLLSSAARASCCPVPERSSYLLQVSQPRNAVKGNRLRPAGSPAPKPTTAHRSGSPTRSSYSLSTRSAF